MKISARRVAEKYVTALTDVGRTEAGHWGREGSGILFSTGEKILLLLRSPGVDKGGTWGIPGGAIPFDDDGVFLEPYKSAKNEVDEEIGFVPPHRVFSKYVFRDGDFKFTTYLASVDTEFEPRLNWESVAWRWASADEIPSRLHPGVAALLRNVDPFF